MVVFNSMDKDNQIYESILRAIVEQRLQAGIRLPEDKLAETFGVSRTGIRKVLQRLALERFVRLVPNKGAEVNRPTPEEAREVLDARLLIEPQLLPAVLSHLTDAHLNQLQQMVKEEDEAGVAGDFARLIQLTARFHYEVAVISNNQLLADFVQQLTYLSSLVISVYGSRRSVTTPCGCHQELIELLRARDLSAATVWMTDHLQHVKDSLQLPQAMDAEVDFKKIFAEMR